MATDLSVQILQSSSGYTRDLYVMSVDNSAKTFTVKFNGAPIGSYTFAVTSKLSYGKIDTSAVSF